MSSSSNGNDIAFFAKTNFRNHDRAFGIKTDDRRRHMYMIGKTGMGKSNLLENLAIQDIQAGRGIAYIDPHGDTAEKLIQAIPTDRLNDVIYFNPADQDFPIAFNILEQVAPEYRSLVASGLIGVFKKLWADSWGPRLEYILRNDLLALLEYPGSTLLGVNRMLVDKDYRKKVLEKVTDPVVRSFWVDEFTKWNDRVLQEVISPIQNKVGQFLSNTMIRNIIGQSQSSFDIRGIMDNRKILIMNLAKGRIGEDVSGMLGALMITKIQLAAMSRVDIPEETRQDFYFYVDEFQNFATDSFANILSEARKYRLNLILANQYVAQLGEVVRDAIFGNAGTIVSFRVGAVDAEFLEKEFEPVFMTNDIVNLPKYHVYLKLMIDGIAGDAFSATTLPPIEIESTTENTEKIIQLSRENYTNSRLDVEDQIRRWSGMLTDEERQAIYALKTVAPTVPAAPIAPRPMPAQPVQPVTPRPVAPRIMPVTPPVPPRPRVMPVAPSATVTPRPPMPQQQTQASQSAPALRQQTQASQSAPALRQQTQASQPPPVAQQSAPTSQRAQSFQQTSVPTRPMVAPIAPPAQVPTSQPTPSVAVPPVIPVAPVRASIPMPVEIPAPETAIESIDVPVSTPSMTAPGSVIPHSLPISGMPMADEDVLAVGAPPEPKPVYIAQCAVCREEIQVPFQPDGKRPTFCREHLKEYQRLAARAREEATAAQPMPQVSQEFPARPMAPAPAPMPQQSDDGDPRPRHEWQAKTYSSTDRPISLYQMQHVAPRQFKSNRPRPDIENIRNLLPKRGEE